MSDAVDFLVLLLLQQCFTWLRILEYTERLFSVIQNLCHIVCDGALAAPCFSFDSLTVTSVCFLCVIQFQFRMCPEFASGHMDKAWRTADRRQRSYRTSSSRSDKTDVRYSHDKNRNVVQRDKWESSYRTAHLEDRELHCNPHHKNYCNSDTERKLRNQHNPSPLEYRRSEHVCGNAVPSRDIYARQDARNDSVTRRHSDNYVLRGNVSQERSPYKERTSHGMLSAHGRSTRPTEQDRYVDCGTRHYANEPESRKYKRMSYSGDEKDVHLSKYSYADNPNPTDKRTSQTTTPSRLSAEQVINDSSATRRRYSNSNRQIRTEFHEDEHSRHVHTGYHNDKSDYQGSSAHSGCRCKLITDACDRHDDRMRRHDVASPVHTRNELNSKSSRDDNLKTCTADRRRSSLRDRCTEVEDEVVSTRKQRSYSDRQQLPYRDHHRRVEGRSGDKTIHDALSVEKPRSRERKRSKRYDESSPPSRVGGDKSGSVFVERTSHNHAPLHGSSREESSSFPSTTHHLSRTDESVTMPAGDADHKQCFVVNVPANNSCPPTVGNVAAVPVNSEYCFVTSQSNADRSMFLGALGQPVVASNQKWVANSDHIAGIHVLQPQWHGSAVMSHRLPSDDTRLHNLMPTSAASQLPLLSTKMSAVPSSIDPRKLGISAVSLNSNVSLSALPSNASFSLSSLQPAGGGGVGQYVVDGVYGDSPLLDEPSYHSPVTMHESSLNLVGSSVSSMDYVRPMDNTELKKMLDVVTVAKTTLEQTLPAGCHSDSYTLRQQKVMMKSLCFCQLLHLAFMCLSSVLTLFVG